MKSIFTFFLAFTIIGLQAQNFFKPVSVAQVAIPDNAPARTWNPTSSSTWQLDVPGVSAVLAAAPMEFTPAAYYNNNTIIAIPQPDGTTEDYAVFKVMTCEQAIYDKYPEIRTFGGYAVNNRAKTIRGSVTMRGMRVMMTGENKSTAFVEPYVDGQTQYYIVYDKKAIPAGLNPTGLSRGVVNDAQVFEKKELATAPVVAERAAAELIQLKTYRYAVSCTGEFGQDHGGTPASAFAAVVEYTNWVNGIFEQDISLRLQLVAGCDLMAFSNPASDPFNNIDPLVLLGDNALVVNGFIGINNYDIAHVYARYPGGSVLGVAGAIGNACVTSGKANGCSTGFQGQYGENFINTLGQELGHQLGGGHTWNRCGGGGGRNGQSAFEPGSGNTIMSYAGACGSDNTQGYSDLYFHSGSIEEIQTYFTLYYGSTCGSFTPTDNHRPEVDFSYQNDFFIPILTPFELNGSATDADGDVLSYCWEQMNTGPETPLETPVGSSPLFRTWPPNDKTNRYFPKLNTILSNDFDLTEQLPTYSRDLTFRLTARDNRVSNGGAGWKDVEFRATEQAGPFLVESPNAVADVWESGKYVNVQWDVANTYAAPVNCKKVNIRLSTDGGLTWPTTLASGVANDGQHTLQVPDMPTNKARIRIDAADNIFFDVSDANFKIVAPTLPALTAGMSENFGDICLPGVFTTQVLTSPVLGFSNPATIEIVPGNLPAEAATSLSTSTVQPGGSSELVVDFSNVTVAGDFAFQIRVTAAGSPETLIDVNITSRTNDFSTMALQLPLDGSTNMGQSQILRWSKADDADSYDLQLSSSATFAPGTLLATKTNTALDTFKIPFLLEKNKAYFWRIRPNNLCSPHAWTEPFFFSTLTENCASSSANDLPKTITSGSTATITSKIELFTQATITDINVKQIKGFHTFFSDLEAKLIAPSGTEVLLFKNKCSNYNGVFEMGLDDSAPNSFACITSGESVRPQTVLAAMAGQSTQGLWTLQIRDLVPGSGGTLEGFQLDVCQSANVNPPYVVNNNVLSIIPGTNQPIPPALLLVEDLDNTHAQLTYTLLSAPQHGFIDIPGLGALQQGAQFTQVDIDNGSLRYFNYGDGASYDDFRFIVTDGNGGYLGNLTFQMEVLVPVKEEIEGSVAFKMYPNPAEDVVWFALDQPTSTPVSLQLLNTSGQVLHSEVVARGQSRFSVATNQLPRGVYFVQLGGTYGVYTQKLILK